MLEHGRTAAVLGIPNTPPIDVTTPSTGAIHPSLLRLTRPPESVLVLVGAPTSGKTTLRGQLAADRADGAEPFVTLSPDDERARMRARDIAAGRDPRDLQDYSLPALRHCATRAEELLALRRGYLADATHLRRKERVAHVRAARDAGLPAVAVLLPHLPLAVLAERNARRPAERRVPEEVLARHANRRGLLSVDLLLTEGFDDVREIPASAQGL